MPLTGAGAERPGQSRGGADRRWVSAVRLHHAAVDAFLRAAASCGTERWVMPRAPGKWSPAQIAEHCTLIFEQLVREMDGGPPFAARASRWRQRMYRWLYLPPILATGSFPDGVRAPREARPAEDSVADRLTIMTRLRAAADAFERRIDDRHRVPGFGLSHPYFGRLGPIRGIRLSTLHLEHHRRQLEV